MTDIPATSVVPVRDALQVQVDTLTTLINAALPPPPSDTVSPDGSTVIAPNVNVLSDKNHHVFRFGAAVDARGYVVERDGVQYGGGVARLMTIKAGVIFVQSGPDPGDWWVDTGTFWDKVAGAPA